MTGLGLRAGRMCYFAGRAAPLGPVGPGRGHGHVLQLQPGPGGRGASREAWEITTPAAVLGERFRAADEALRRLLGPEITASDDVPRLAGLAREAASACRPRGRPLYAAHADLDWPDEPLLAMWHAISLLREHRGDGHLAALTAAGLSGIEALITHTATGTGFVPEFAMVSRGWTAGRMGCRGGRAGRARPAGRRRDADRGRAGTARPGGTGNRPDGRAALAAPRRRAHRGGHRHRAGDDPRRGVGRRLPSHRRVRPASLSPAPAARR